jgi:hypothetical protein
VRILLALNDIFILSEGSEIPEFVLADIEEQIIPNDAAVTGGDTGNAAYSKQLGIP